MSQDKFHTLETTSVLAERAARLVRAQAIAKIGSWEINLTTHKMWGSTEAFRIYGLTMSTDNELPLEIVQAVPLIQYRPLLNQALAELLSDGKPYDIEFEIRRQDDGAIRHIHSLAELIRTPSGQPEFISGTLHDDTETVERDRALFKALRSSEERARMMFEQAADAIFLGNTVGDFVGVNERAVKLTGYSREELLNGNMRMLFAPQVQQQTPLQYARVLSGEIVINERDLRRKDGNVVPVEMHTKKLTDGTLQSIVRDLTERRRLEQQLQLRQRMDSIGTLTAGIAHDFNNILAGIMGYAHLLAETPETLGPESTEYVSNILQATERAADLVQSLKSLTRQQPVTSTSFDLFDVVNEVHKVLQATTDRLIRKEFHITPRTCLIRGNASDIYHALMNLGINAVQAIEQKGATVDDRVTFDAEPCEIDAENPLGLSTGRYARITVSDTGVGMTAEVRARAFEPLYSTKSHGERKGQGLGLAMVYNIVVSQHGGAVDVETSQGQGCRFHLYLPSAEVLLGEVSTSPSAPPQGHECVLVVEDEPQLAHLIRTILERRGYEVRLANDGQEAVALFERERQTIQLVLLDRSLPGLRGEQVFARLKELCPDIPVVVSSGDALLPVESFQGAYKILQKPYRPMQLASIVRAALDERSKPKSTVETPTK